MPLSEQCLAKLSRLQSHLFSVWASFGSFLSRIAVLLYAKITARQFVKSKQTSILLFSDVPDSARLGFDSIYSIREQQSSLSGRLRRCVIVLTSKEGLDYFFQIRKVLSGNYVLFLGSGVSEERTPELAELKKIGSFPFEAYSELFTFRDELFTPYHLLFLLIGLWGVGFHMKAFYPKDDLLRHSIAYLWNYDYSIPYHMTTFSPTFDHYIGFDVIIGFFHRIIGDSCLIVPQLFALILTVLATNKLLEGVGVNVRIILIMFTVQYLATRIMLGRPSIVCSSIMLMLYAYDKEIKTPVKLLVGLWMIVLYYFSFIYMIPLIIRDRKYLLPTLGGLVFWLVYSRGQYFSETMAVIQSLKEQNMEMSENKGIMVFYLGMMLFVLPMVYYWRRDKKTLLSALYMSLSNQLRYVETILPLVVSFFRFVPIKLRVTPLMSLGVVFMLVPQLPWTPQKPMELIPSKIPAEARVLTNMELMYQTVFRNPHVQISPCYAYGWTNKPAQKAIKNILNGSISCNDPVIKEYDYLIEGSLQGSLEECVELIAVENGNRLWKVRN